MKMLEIKTKCRIQTIRILIDSHFFNEGACYVILYYDDGKIVWNIDFVRAGEWFVS